MNLNLRNRRAMKMLATVQLIAFPWFVRKGHSPRLVMASRNCNLRWPWSLPLDETILVGTN